MIIHGGAGRSYGRATYPPPTDQHTRIAIQGQSNAIGVGSPSELSTSPLSSDSGLASYYTGGFSRVFIWTGSSYDALNRFNNAAVTGALGPEFGIAVRWMRETSVSNLYIDKHTVDGGAISQFQNGTSFWTNCVSDYSAGSSWLASNSVSPVDGGWLWVQGESNHADIEADYLSALTTYIASRLSQPLQGPTSKRILSQICTTSTGYGAGVTAANTSYAASNSSTTRTIDYRPYLNVDSLHLNAQGQVQLGYDAFEKLFSTMHIDT